MNKHTSKLYFQTLTIIHGAVVMGVVLFFLVNVFVFKRGELADENTNNTMMILVAIMSIGGVVGGSFLSKIRNSKTQKLPDIKEKMADYRKTLIIQYALMEGPALFSLISFMITQNQIFLMIAAILIAIFIALRPSKNKAIEDLRLTHAEKTLINNPEAIISQ